MVTLGGDDDQAWRAPAAGTLAALAGFGVIALIALVGWLAAPGTTSWTSALGVAAGLWFLGSGQSVATSTVPVSIVPLGALAAQMLLAAYAVRWIAPATDDAAGAAPDVTAAAHHRYWRVSLPAYLGGYAAAGLVVYLLSFAGGLRPSILALLGVLGVPILAAGLVSWGQLGRGEVRPPIDGWFERIPLWMSRALRPAWQGAAALMAVGLLFVLVLIVGRWSTITGLYAASGAGFVGIIVLTLAQLTMLPTAAVWAVAWLAGPGFTVGEGTAMTPSGTQAGLVPAIPLFGVLPQEGSYPGWVILVLAVPIVVGVFVSWSCSRRLARLTRWQTKVLTSLTAVVGTAGIMTVLTDLSSGSLGTTRLAAIGPSGLATGVTLLIELLIGATLHTSFDLLRRRH